jgi:hypothetical protein
MECDRCNETCRERETRETFDGLAVCPDCADDMSECSECELLFVPEEEGQELCPGCRDQADEEDDEPIKASVPTCEEWAAEIARDHHKHNKLGALTKAEAREHAALLAESGYTRYAAYKSPVIDFDPEEWQAACAAELLRLGG